MEIPEKHKRIWWWLSRGFVRSYSHDAIEAPRIMFSCEGIEFIPIERAKRIVRDVLLREADYLRVLADAIMLPYDYQPTEYKPEAGEG